MFQVLAMVFGVTLSPMDQMNARLGEMCFEPTIAKALPCDARTHARIARMAWAIVRK